MKLDENSQTLQIRKVVSELIDENNIKGAVLVKGRACIIAYDIIEGNDYKTEIPKIMSIIEKENGFNECRTGSIFAHCILDYNGCKVVAKKLKNDLTLMIMMQKQGYVGPTMLELESSAREIERIINEREPNNGEFHGEIISSNQYAYRCKNKKK